MPEIRSDAATPVNKSGEDVQATSSFRIVAPPTEDDFSKRLEQVYQLSFQMFEKATAYENVILVAGYAGFFALWSSVADDLGDRVKYWAVGLMGISLAIYVMFHISQMATRAAFQYKMMAVVAKKIGDPDFHEVWSEELSKPQHASAIVMMVWPFVLASSLLTGLGGGLLVAVAAIRLALQPS